MGRVRLLGGTIAPQERAVILTSVPPDASEEDGKERLDPLVLGSLTLIGLTPDELTASDRRLKRAGLFHVPEGSLVMLLAPTRGGLARLVSIGRVLVTVSSLPDAHAASPAPDPTLIEEMEKEIGSIIGRNSATPLRRALDGYLIVAENVLRPGLFHPGLGELPDEGYLVTETWLEIAGLRGGISGLWGRTWGRLYVLEAEEGLLLMLGLLASSPTLEDLVRGELRAAKATPEGRFEALIRGELRRLRYLGWHLMFGGQR